MDKLRERFWAKVNKYKPGECWIWTGNFARDGYGRFYIYNKRIAAHRISYFLAYGFFPSHYHVDHLCQIKDCVNPVHLEAVTPEENRRRVDERR